jgi:sugar phosphate isomerase/epimerase
VIENLNELLELFGERNETPPGQVYNASLSTMWGIRHFPGLKEFFLAAGRLGFARVELNHQVDSAMLAQVDLERYTTSSIHEPCPADISLDELKRRGWLVSALDEASRHEGVKSVQRSIDLARQLGAGAVVIHCGSVDMDRSQEDNLRKLYLEGRAGTDEYQRIQESLVARRQELAPARLESVRKSILELLEYARPTGVRLGLENRFHYMEFPSPDELEMLIGLAGEQRIGVIYDVGHAQTLDRLGFYPHETWLKRFSRRIIGVHLHDVVGITDHYTPGKGEVDFDRVAAYLPEQAFRTCEFQGFNSFEDVKIAMKFLLEHGCIHYQ